MIVLIAKLERDICLIVYFSFKSYCFNFADSTMTTINKIYLQVLVQLLGRENLICSFIWIFQLAMSAVCSIRDCSQEVKEDLASKHRLCNPKTDYESNYIAPKQTVIGISHWDKLLWVNAFTLSSHVAKEPYWSKCSALTWLRKILTWSDYSLSDCRCSRKAVHEIPSKQ